MEKKIQRIYQKPLELGGQLQDTWSMTQLHFTHHQKTTSNNNSIQNKRERKPKIKYAQDLHVENLVEKKKMNVCRKDVLLFI